MKLLLATDGSEGALRAAAFVGRLARESKELEITVVYVAPPPAPARASGTYGEEYVPDVPLDAMIEHSAEPVWAATLQAMGPVGGRVATQVAIGEPAEEIARLAEWDRYDMIVVGRRGLGPVKELVLGSVSHRLVHQASCPVLVAR